MKVILAFLAAILGYLVLDRIFKTARLGKWSMVMQWVCAVMVCIILWVQSETSLGRDWASIRTMEGQYQLLNIATIAMVYMFFFVICCKVGLSCLLTTIFVSILSLVNYYTLIYHGMPFSILDLQNVRTAANVFGSYTLIPDNTIKKILLLYLACIIVSLICKKIWIEEKTTARKRILSDLVGVCYIVAVLIVGYFGPNPIKPLNTITWLWSEPYYQYGYAACSVEMCYTALYAVQEPEGYSDQYVDEIEIAEDSRENYETPDIILILNESFYDLSLIVDLETDVDYLEHYHSNAEAIKGYCFVPQIGGGTNCSEYELLTSNSLQLMPGITPFNDLSLVDAYSIVSVLKDQGYYTIGSHSQPAVNYNRANGYAELGFDKTFFQGDFQDLAYYYGRGRETDESVYLNLERWYSEAIQDTDQPVFIYNLTFQNHGAYSMLSEETYLVHVQGDYGDLTSTINEYLTGIYQSDMALQNLLEYYRDCERSVIVCMVGDHCPDFAIELVDEEMDGEEKNRKLRSVPFFIWSNQGLDAEEVEMISMNMLNPKLLSVAGVQMSPYYQYLYDLSADVPAITAYDTYFDAEGNAYSYDEESEYQEDVQKYFYMEYNNLKSVVRREELFAATP